MALIEMKGLTIPDDAVVLGCQLERRGYVFSRQGDRLMLTKAKDTDPGPLSDADRAGIAQWKWHLLAVVDLGVEMNGQDR